MSETEGPTGGSPTPPRVPLQSVAESEPPFDVISETLQLLRQHGKRGWRVEWDGAKRRAGATHYAHKKITYSKPLAVLYPEATLREVMLHEVGHALAGQRSGHGEKWAQAVRLLGGSPSVTLPAHLPKPEARWLGQCPRCGATRALHSAPRRVVSCGKCSKTFDGRLVFTWYLHGRPEIPPGAYLKELRMLQSQGKVA